MRGVYAGLRTGRVHKLELRPPVDYRDAPLSQPHVEINAIIPCVVVTKHPTKPPRTALKHEPFDKTLSCMAACLLIGIEPLQTAYPIVMGIAYVQGIDARF